MSVSLMSEVWRLDLSPTDKMVLLALADAANDDGVTWIAVQSRKAGKLDLLTKCSLSERAIQGALKRLAEGGYLTRKENPGRGVLYTITPAPAAPPQQMPPADDDMNPRTSCGETVSNHHTTSGTNVPSVMREKPKSRRPSRRCPDDWFPTNADRDAGEPLSPGEIERQLAKFRDHEFAKPRSDWSATFRNWLRTAVEKAPNVHQRHTAPQRNDRIERMLAGAVVAADQ